MSEDMEADGARAIWNALREKPLPLGPSDMCAAFRAALSVVRKAEGWRTDMAAGRRYDGEALLLLADGAVIRARYDGGLVGEDGADAWGWQASIEGAHPSCWDDGICWAENADGDESTPPVAWMPFLPPPPEAKP